MTGNGATRREIILRELPLRTGDLLDPEALAEGRNNLYDLGIFREVRYVLPEPVSPEAPQDLVIAVGEGDTVDTYLLYSNSHDGSRAVDMRIGPVRVVCQNTLNLALSEKARRALRRAHDARLAFLERDAREFFRAITGEVEAARRSFAALQAAPMDDPAFRAFLERLLPLASDRTPQ